MAIKVCIVEDNTDIRQALEQILQMNPNDIEWAGSFISGEEAVEGIPDVMPNVVLMDINLGGMSGIECVRTLKPAHPEVLYMMCTVLEEDEKIFEALEAGANGYILKKTTPVKMLEAIRELYEGGAPMSTSIARKVVSAFQQKKEDKTLDLLTSREKEILELLAKGLMYREISAQLFIAQETVRKHCYRIYEKLHVSNRIEAINKFYGR